MKSLSRRKRFESPPGSHAGGDKPRPCRNHHFCEPPPPHQHYIMRHGEKKTASVAEQGEDLDPPLGFHPILPKHVRAKSHGSGWDQRGVAHPRPGATVLPWTLASFTCCVLLCCLSLLLDVDRSSRAPLHNKVQRNHKAEGRILRSLTMSLVVVAVGGG